MYKKRNPLSRWQFFRYLGFGGNTQKVYKSYKKSNTFKSGLPTRIQIKNGATISQKIKIKSNSFTKKGREKNYLNNVFIDKTIFKKY